MLSIEPMHYHVFLGVEDIKDEVGIVLACGGEDYSLVVRVGDCL